MNAAELMVKCLEAEGVSNVFALPGEENAELMFALEDSSIDVVITRHEQGAGFMAEAYGRLTGAPAVALATLGPGASNLLTPIADANMDRAPMIAITGQGGAGRMHKESHQIIDGERLFGPVTKWSHSVRVAESIPEVIRKAVRLAQAEKPGAVVIELPEDIAGLAVERSPLEPRRFYRPAPTAARVDAFVDELRAANSPLIIAGNGAIRTRASAELRCFVDLTGIGVVSTFMGKGAVDMDREQCLYTIGLSQRDHIMAAIDAADLIICVGYDLVEYPPSRWNAGGAAKVVHIDFHPAEIDAQYDPCLELVGDIAEALRAAGDRLAANPPSFELSVQREVRARMKADLAEFADDDAIDAIKPQRAVADMRRALGPSDILLSGVGAHKMWVARYYHCHEPNTCLIPNGYCAMGAALPGALGAKIARPDARVMAIAGDGDFLMNVQEMETARRLDSDVTIVVWVDNAYGLIAWKQQDEFGRHTELGFGNPHWAQLAAAFGWAFWAPTRSADLLPALLAALDYSGPSLVVLPIDYRENERLSQRLGALEPGG